MELGSQQNGGVLVNGTRAVEALSKLLNNSRRTIIQVEALVTVAAALLLLQLVLATWKRRWPNSFVSGALSVCNASLLPLVFYTLSIMQSSPAKNSMYPVWGASLLMGAGGAIAVRQFDVDERSNKATMESLSALARYLFYMCMLIFLSVSPGSSSTKKPQPWHIKPLDICIVGLFLSIYVTKAMDFVSRISPFLIPIIYNKFCMKKNANDHQNDTDHETMKGDKHLLGDAVLRPKAKFITIDKVWGYCGNSDHGEILENVCLSHTLCWSLRERFWGLSSARASLPTTYDSYFSELLQNEEHYERAFKIIEVELGFCYDYFFTKYHCSYLNRGMLSGFFLCREIFLTLVLVYTVQGSMTIPTSDPIVEVHITKADYILTIVLLGTALLVELLQALLYLASDWTKVSLAYQYVKHQPNSFLEKLVGLFSRVTNFSLRRNKIAQYTVILPDKTFFKYFLKCNLNPVEISSEIEKAIAGSIKPTFGEQTNRLASQVRTSMFEHRTLKDHWTLKDHSQVEIMLIWHIATDYCHVSPSSGNGINPEKYVAVTLSRYCAYLLAFVPQLLPYHVADINKLIDTVKEDVAEKLNSSLAPLERYQKMKELGDDPPTVFRKGVKLGKQLEGMRDEAESWKAMAEFWAKTIIYIAPSHITAKEHIRQLENGGEFLTHIWALLSHAGILNLVRDDDEVAKPAQAKPQPAQETLSAQAQPAQEIV